MLYKELIFLSTICKGKQKILIFKKKEKNKRFFSLFNGIFKVVKMNFCSKV